MGNYNEQQYPNIQQDRVLLRTYDLYHGEPIYTDEWNVEPTKRVMSVHDGTGKVKCKVVFNPTNLSNYPP